MIIFAKKLLLFVSVIAIVTLAVNFLYIKWHKADPNQTNKFAFIPKKVQVCNFGSSHGMYGFNYEDLGNAYDCFNFGLSSQFLSYDYRLFQYYGDHIGEGTVVFIPISYFSLFGTEETSRVNFASKNSQYYSVLPASLIKEYDAKTDIYVRYFPALVADTGDLILTLLGKSKDTNDENWQRVATDIDVSEHAEERYVGHVGNKHFYDDGGNRIENQEEIDALCALIKGCQEKGAIPVLITTPYLHEYTDAIKENAEDFYDQFYSIIDQVTRNTGVEYYDYAFDERFSSEYSWFINCDHLNKEGAKIFVDILMNEIVYAKGYF